MSSKHTPGPWWIEKDGSAENNNEVNVVNGADGTMIVYGQANDADARLIAAAPELLEALERVEGLAMADDWRDLPEIVRIARAAIAKATGGAA